MTIDPNYGHHESCACLRPGDNGCNCHKAYGFDTAEAMEESEATPPAHGDGEAYPTSSDREVLLYLMQQFDAESWQCPCGRSESCADMDSALYLRNYLTTRPTPEARTGTVADIPDADLLCRAVHQLAPRARRQPAWARIADVFALGSTYATQLCRRFGVDPETGKKVDALALPAQGEGKV